MQLSSKARKAVAAGLAFSTILWASVGLVPQFASAAVHSDGCLVLSGGIVWMITGGTRRGYTSAEVFQSWGYNFSQVVTASAEDVALPVGPIMVYADGTLVKGPSDPLVYLVAGGQKRPFVSGSVFLGLGFSFANIQMAPANTFADLPVGANLDSTTIAHPAGVQVISNGAVFWMDANGRRGFPSAANFQSYGYKFSHVVSANAADLASPNLGDVPDRAGCTGGGTPPPVSGAFSVSLASDTPAATSIITDNGNGGQALAPIGKFNITGGSSGATITTMTFHRIGVGSDSSVNNAYLYDGNTRLAQMQSITSGVLTFTNSAGLFTVSPNTVRAITVKMDLIKSGSITGQSYGFALNSASDVVATGNVNPSGSFPISSSLMTVATVSDLGKLTVSSISPAGAATVDPGQTGYQMWQFTLAATNQNLKVTYLAFTNVGSTGQADIQNIKLMDGGVQVGSTVAQQDANRVVAFDLSANPLMITAGVTKTMYLVGNIVGGSTRNFAWSFQNSSDIQVMDTQYNVSLFPGGNNTFSVIRSNSSGTYTTVNSGSLSINRTSDSPSGNVALSGTSVNLAKFEFKANGEPVKVANLNVRFNQGTSTSKAVKNLRLFVNGVQVGTTQATVTGSSDANSVTTVNANDVVFTLGNSMIVQPGTSSFVTIQGDLTATTNPLVNGDAIQLTLVQTTGNVNANNAQGQTSLTSFDAPKTANVSGNSLTVATGALNVASNSSVANMTVVAGSLQQLVGSAILTAGSAEAVDLNSITIVDADGVTGNGLGAALNNITAWNGTTKLGSTIVNPSTVTGTTQVFNISPALHIAAASSVQIDFKADILSGATLDSSTTGSDAVQVSAASGVGSTTSTTVSLGTGITARLQTFTLATAGTITVSVDSSTPQDQQVVMGSSQNTLGVWKVQANNAENLTLNQLIFVDNSADKNSSANVSNLKLYVNGSPVGNTVAGLSNLTNTTNTAASLTGAATTVQLGSDASAVNSFYNGNYIVFLTNASAGHDIGKVGRITGYVGSTKVATITPVGVAFTVEDHAGATYKIVSGALFSGMGVNVPSNSNVLVTLKGDISNSTNAIVGLRNRFVLGTLASVAGAGTDTVVAVGASSGSYASLGSNTNTAFQANNSYAYRTKIGVALNSASPSGVGRTRQANDVILKTDFSSNSGFESRIRAGYTATGFTTGTGASNLTANFDGTKAAITAIGSGTSGCSSTALAGLTGGGPGAFATDALVCTASGTGASTIVVTFSAGQDLQQFSAVSFLLKQTVHVVAVTPSIVDSTGNSAGTAVTPVLAEWQQVVMPLTGIASANKDAVTALSLAFTPNSSSDTIVVAGVQFLYDYVKVNLAGSDNGIDSGRLVTMRNDNNSAIIASGVSSITTDDTVGFVVFAPTQAQGDFVIPAGSVVPTSLLADTTLLLEAAGDTLSASIPLGSSSNGTVTAGNVYWYDGYTPLSTTTYGSVLWVNANPNTINGNGLSY